MASVADNSTAMQVMHDANIDFLELIKNFKDFFNGDGPVTFSLIPNGNLPISTGTITMNSLQKLVSDYRNGIFESVVIGNSTGARFIITTNSDGQLSITDMDGNPASVACKKFTGSEITSSTVNTMTATSCDIKSLETPLAVRGGSAALNSLKLNYLEVSDLETPHVDASLAFVRDSLTCNELLVYGARKLIPPVVKDIFYRDNSPIDNAVAGIYFESSTYWDMRPSPGHVTPSDMGFKTSYFSGSPMAGCSMPNMVRLWGNNLYSKFRRTVLGGLRFPDNIEVYASINGTSFTDAKIEDGKVFPNLIAWPTGFVSPEDGTYGHLYLSSFLPSDIGKEIFYRTDWHHWVIFRTMLVSVVDGNVTGVSFTDEIELPKFTCTRFIVNKHDPLEESADHPANRQIAYTLERA